KAYEFGNKTAAAYKVGAVYGDFLKDPKNALKWFRIAYYEGVTHGAYGLGLTYKHDLKDYPKAIEWYEIAHKGGDKDSAYALGILYEDIYKDYPKALKWYEIACDLYKKQNGAHNGAMARIGILYLEGRGVEKDLVKARSFLEQAAKGGSDKAKEALAALDRNQAK
ncbi:MAG: sel1 repeat family protein, partial [Helicobacteraceae bacterium]|nr:sel1 repeat family protein [Helicobacteraceae bacterium]